MMITRLYYFMDDEVYSITEAHLRTACGTLGSKGSVRDLIGYIKALYCDAAYMYTDSTDDTTEAVDKRTRWLAKFGALVNLTYNRYNTILEAYTDSQSKLLDSLHTTSTVKFNDTPQDTTEQDDAYTTNITSSETTTDIGTAMSKLNEIQKKYDDVMRNWIKEFDGLFMEV